MHGGLWVFRFEPSCSVEHAAFIKTSPENYLESDCGPKGAEANVKVGVHNAENVSGKIPEIFCLKGKSLQETDI
jgi:hypothetical protein